MPEILKMITGFSDLPLSYFGAEKGKKNSASYSGCLNLVLINTNAKEIALVI